MINTSLYCGDCLELMKSIQDNSIDMILCDLPYQTTPCSWDIAISLPDLWLQYERIVKHNGAIVLFATQPFTSVLTLSNLPLYKYNWVWVKENASNFLNKKYQPGKITEDICVFGKAATSYSKNGNMIYNPQIESGKPYTQKSGKQKLDYGNSTVRTPIKQIITENDGSRLPNNILQFKRDKEKLHPTQKPVALLEYLIKTYTNTDATVLDNCMGSGSTGVACINTDRNFIGIEMNQEYFDIASQRIEESKKTHMAQVSTNSFEQEVLW